MLRDQKYYLWFFEIKIRSEHVVDGRRFDGELIFVHGENVARPFDLSFVSVLLDASSVRDEPKLQVFIDEWQAAHDSIVETCNEAKILQASDRQHHPAATRAKDDHFFESLANSVGENDEDWNEVLDYLSSKRVQSTNSTLGSESLSKAQDKADGADQRRLEKSTRPKVRAYIFQRLFQIRSFLH